MTESDEALNFKRYCGQLEKYSLTESVHSPVMALLRRKARKQLIELMKQKADCAGNINKLWMVGYYHPFQYNSHEAGDAMEMTTLLTMFCGELQEMLLITDERYHSLWNLYIGDLHRYMAETEIQKILTAGFYSRAIELDSKQGRAFHMLATVRNDLSVEEKLRLMLLGQLAGIPYKKSSEMEKLIKSEKSEENIDGLHKIMIEFADWVLNDTSKQVNHQFTGLKLINDIKPLLENLEGKNLSMMMSVCRLANNLAYKNHGYQQFINGFDVLSSFYMAIFSRVFITKSLLSESISWICDVGEVFGSIDQSKNEPYFASLSVFTKTKWNELNDIVMENINKSCENEPFIVASSPSSDLSLSLHGPTAESTNELLGHVVNKLIAINHPTMEINRMNSGNGPLLRRINQSVQKRLDFPIGALAEEVNREDWRPVYVLMDFYAIIDNIRIARKIWDIDDFICILPSNVLDQLDQKKSKIKSVRPIIRTLMELQAEGRMILKKCKDESHCAAQLVQSAKVSSKDHKHIVAFLCKHPEDQQPMDGVTFYDIQQFYKKYLE